MSDPFPKGITAPQEWLDGLIPKLPSVPPDMIKHELLTVMRDFFTYSTAWQEWISVVAQPNVIEYPPQLTDVKAEIISILDGYSDGPWWWLRPAQPGIPGVDIAKRTSGSPRWYHLTPQQQFCIFPATKEGTTNIRLYCAMKPIDLCVPDWIRSRFYDILISGVLSNMYLTPGANFNADMGRVQRKMYMNGRSKAMIDARVGYTGIQEQVPYNRGFARGYQRVRNSAWRGDNLA